jgi:anti-anti-sigma regulatory factor
MMSINTTLHRVDAADPASSLAEALANADRQEESSELLLDFTGVRRVDTASVRSLAGVADTAAARSIKLTARAVTIEVYKVLKLAGLAERMSFM